MLFVGRVERRNLVQQLLPILGEGSNIIVISSLGARAVAGTPDCPVLASFNVSQSCRAPGGMRATRKLWQKSSYIPVNAAGEVGARSNLSGKPIDQELAPCACTTGGK